VSCVSRWNVQFSQSRPDLCIGGRRLNCGSKAGLTDTRPSLIGPTSRCIDFARLLWDLSFPSLWPPESLASLHLCDEYLFIGCPRWLDQDMATEEFVFSTLGTYNSFERLEVSHRKRTRDPLQSTSGPQRRVLHCF